MRSLLCISLILVGIGCSAELGPEKLPTSDVKGRVRLSGQPIASGWVEFWPVGGTLGNFRVAPIRPDGTFEIRGVAVGTNRIVLAHVPLREILTFNGRVAGHIFMNLPTSPIELQIKADGNAPIELDLGMIANEYLQKQRRNAG